MAAVVSDRGEASVLSGSSSLADRLRLGSLAEDGFSYKEKFIVRCYEVGINKTATVETIANLLQVNLSELFRFWSLSSDLLLSGSITCYSCLN